MDSNTSNMAVSAVAHASTNTVAGRSDNAKSSASESKSPAKTSAPSNEDNAPQRDPRSLQYQVDGDRVITTIVDENDNTVVVQIPDAEVIRIAKAIDRMQGFLLEQKA
jgi:flagellar protein FlaG